MTREWFVAKFDNKGPKTLFGEQLNLFNLSDATEVNKACTCTRRKATRESIMIVNAALKRSIYSTKLVLLLTTSTLQSPIPSKGYLLSLLCSLISSLDEL